MTGLRARHPFTLTFVHCLRRALLPVLGATGASALLRTATTTPLAGLETAPGAQTPWLHLPLVVAAFACAAAAATFWPLFAARRPGRDQVERLQRGPLRGCGAALAGALLAQLVLTLPLMTGFARLLGAPATAVAHVELPVPPQPLLTATQPRLSFALGDRVLDEVRLRPAAGPPTGPWQPTHVRVHVDGAPAAAAEVTFEQSLQLVRVPLPARPLHTLELEFVSGTVPLLFPRGAVVAVEAGTRSGLWNGVRAAWIYLLPSFVALALAMLFGAAATLPTVLTAAGGLLFVGTIGGAGPADDAVRSLLRGHEVLAGRTFSACIPSLAAGSLAMIVAMLLRRRLGR
ncbi:MAG: hypothetical protein JNM25_10580 [Planctomycetes bacterium]|nr:hypothetical protein [Planctomycetota bacterium]